ncbi:hypothetical protein L873DRAFT_207427 [Choiromyces venosus 120613-1]|uniref:Uncharacterized protein n=1 Tax=Choiromyces venosus 120613-1 TaxID=1336337 RepID=A0A3N4J1R0_9PEZI|nr:hypothetical protein L873DRAFT_207427 [Choiromyces venosus 120613-1]
MTRNKYHEFNHIFPSNPPAHHIPATIFQGKEKKRNNNPLTHQTTKMPIRHENFTSIHFTHYPPLIVTDDRLDPSPFLIPFVEVNHYYSLARKAFNPLLKHMTNPSHVTTILASFSSPPPPPPPPSPPTTANNNHTLPNLTTNLTVLFPGLLFPQIAQCISTTQETTDQSVKRRNKWLRGEVKKHLAKCREGLEMLRNVLISRIVASELAERHPELVVLEWVVGNLLEWRGGRSLVVLEGMLKG